MNSRVVAIASWLLVSVICGCGGDDDSPGPTDSGTGDGGDIGGRGGSGSGGRGGEGSGGNGSGDGDYSIGGEVSGLTGRGLVLALNGDEQIEILDNGAFTFATKLDGGADYVVMVATQPRNPVQACELSRGEGVIEDRNIDDIRIECSDGKRSIGGTVSGLGGGELRLKNNGGDDLTVKSDGSFTFRTALAPGADYDVSIAEAPANRTCSLTRNQGKADSNVTDVTVACYEGLTLAARARVKSVALSWNDNGASAYTLYRSDERCNFDSPDACAGAKKQENVRSPYTWVSDVENEKVYYFHVRGKHADNFETRSPASNVAGARPNVAEVDEFGVVRAITRGDDNTLYIGGAFSSVGPFTGPLAPIDRSTGVASRLPNFPIFRRPSASPDGSAVSSVIADNAGGYFVGGTFDAAVGGATIKNLAHVKPDGTLDAAWNPDPDGNIGALALVDGTLYFAGTFQNVSGVARPGLAAVSATGTGALDTTWTPSLDPARSVDTLVANSSGVYASGSFTQIGGATRQYLAGLSLGTGAAIESFPDAPDGTVSALALASDVLYVAGNFENVGGEERHRLAGIHLGTGAVVPDVQLGSTQASAPDALAVLGDLLFLGGSFTSVEIDAQTTPRQRLAAINRNSGDLITSWDPRADGAVQALAAVGDTLYVAGDFRTIGDTSRKYLAAIKTDGSLSDWSPQPGSPITGISVDNDTVYAFGSQVRSFGGEPHEKLASFKDGALTGWGPAVLGGDVLSLAVAGGTVYVGGSFDTIGGVARNGAAAVTDNNNVGDWNPALGEDAEVRAIAVGNDRVYLGGFFTQGGSSGTTHVIAVQPDSGAKHPDWTLIGVNNGVHALLLDGSDLFLGGEFTTAGTIDTRPHLAKLDASTGAVDAWNPGASGTVRALQSVGDFLVVGGDFGMLANGASHSNLGAVTKADGNEVDWDADLDAPVTALAKQGSLLYVAGAFSELDVSPAAIEVQRFVAFDGGAAFAYVASYGGPSGTVHALAADDNLVYFGGETYGTADGNRCRYFCSARRPGP